MPKTPSIIHPNPEDQFVAFIAIDWADEKHDVALQEPDQKRIIKRQLTHSPEALNEWLTSLRQKYNNGKIAVCLEQSKGSLINFLMSHDIFTLYPINPITLANFREAFYPSKAKSDPKDTDLLLAILLHHRDQLIPWKPDSVVVRTIAILTEKRRKAVNHRVAICNQLKALLKQFFPQALSLISEELHANLSCQFLLQWPSLEALQKVRTSTIEKFYRSHHCYKSDVIKTRLEAVRKAVPLTSDAAILDTAPIELKMLVTIIQQINDSIVEYDQQLKILFPNHPYAAIFSSFPGAGTIHAARLASAFGSDQQRFDSPNEIQTLSGVAPITVESGKSHWIGFRRACPKFMRQTFVEYSGQSIQQSLWAKAYYTMMKEKGKSHNIILRALAFKWIRIMFRCWKNNQPYDEIRYLKSLQKRQSPVLKFMAIS